MSRQTFNLDDQFRSSMYTLLATSAATIGMPAGVTAVNTKVELFQYFTKPALLLNTNSNSLDAQPQDCAVLVVVLCYRSQISASGSQSSLLPNTS
jgi:hypothetical protein